MSAKMHISKSFQLLLISLSGPAAWNSLSLICTTCTETEVLKNGWNSVVQWCVL